MKTHLPIIQHHREVFKKQRGESIIDMDKHNRCERPFYIAKLETYANQLLGKFPLRRQSQHHFELIIKGHGSVTVGCAKFGVTDNMLITVPARVPHSGEFESGEIQGFIFGFDPDFFINRSFPRHLVDNRRLLNHPPVPGLQLNASQTSHLASILQFLLEESERPGAEVTGNEIIAVKILEFLIFSDRYSTGSESRDTDPGYNKLVVEFNTMVDKYFKDHRSVNFYAQALSLHPNSLNSAIKFHSGHSAKSMINKRIAEESRYLLSNTDGTVKEIAHALGFEDPNYFSFFFKREMGLSPLEYKNMMHFRSTA